MTTIKTAHLTQAFNYLSEAILLTDAQGKILYANPFLISQYQLEDRPLKGDDVTAVLQVRQHQADANIITLSSRQNWRGQALFLVGEGLPDIVRVEVDRVEDGQGKVSNLIIRLTERDSAAQDTAVLQELAYKDELTGLANRTLFNQLLEHELSQSRRDKKRFALLFIDLDKFKQVNDSLGHDAGDLLLCTIAERMQKTLRKSDVIARLGGDEFVVIMHDVKDSDTVARVAEKVIRQVQKPVISGPHRMDVGCSVGISLYPDNGNDAEHLLHFADVAMYRAKQQGGANYYYFSEELNKELKDIRLMEEQLSYGLRDKQFVPYFQPLIDRRNNQLVGIECLARWQHPHKGMLQPMAFIPVASKLGLVTDILEQVLDHAFANLQQWHNQLDRLIPLSINITSQQFYQHQTFDMLKVLLKRHHLSADAVRIEVTESTLQEKGDGLIERLQKVSTAGFSITLDDFGTGYSSLRYLQQLPVDTLKIDRSFVRNLDNNPHDKIIVKAIIQLAHTLGIEAVAEGVETASQCQFLEQNHCHIMQGFYFSQALPASEFDAYVDGLALNPVT